MYAVHLCLGLVLEMLETLHRTPMTRTIRGVQKDAKVSGGIISFWILECIDGWCISDAARKDPQADAQKHRYPVSVYAYLLLPRYYTFVFSYPRHLNVFLFFHRNVHTFKL